MSHDYRQSLQNFVTDSTSLKKSKVSTIQSIMTKDSPEYEICRKIQKLRKMQG